VLVASRSLKMATSRPQNPASKLHLEGQKGSKGNRIRRTYEIYRNFDPHRPYQDPSGELNRFSHVRRAHQTRPTL
jgi:hypothetical protein